MIVNKLTKNIFVILSLIICVSGINVRGHQKISFLSGGFSGALGNWDNFGVDVANIGDLDGDGVFDLVVGAPFDDVDNGAVWIVFLNANGTVKNQQKISDTIGGFTGGLSGEQFGYCVCSLGDLDGDGVEDIAVGAPYDDDGGKDRGAVWILFLNDDGTVKSHQKISDTEGSFTATLTNNLKFGSSLSAIGDLNDDDIVDIVVGTPESNIGGAGRGAIWILFLDTTGEVKQYQTIASGTGSFTGTLSNQVWFGYAITSLGDLDNDGVEDIAVGAPYDNDGGTYRGAVWILFLNDDGTVKSHQKISQTEGGFSGTLVGSTIFAGSLSPIGDINGDGVVDIAVGVPESSASGDRRGAFWILCLNPAGIVIEQQHITSGDGGFTGTLSNGVNFATSLTSGDVDGDGVLDIIAGSPVDNDGGTARGAVWVLFMDGPPVTTVDEIETTFNEVKTTTVAEPITTTVDEIISTTIAEPISTTVALPTTENESTEISITTTTSVALETQYTPSEYTNPIDITGTNLKETTEQDCTSKNSLCLYSTCDCGRNVIIYDVLNINNENFNFLVDFVALNPIHFTDSKIQLRSTSGTFYKLSLVNSKVDMDYASTFIVENELSISDSTLNLHLTSHEKESILQNNNKPLFDVRGNINGDFQEVNIFVDDMPDHSLELSIQHGSVTQKRSSILTIIVITCISLLIVGIIIFIFLHPRTKELLFHSTPDEAPEMRSYR